MKIFLFERGDIMLKNILFSLLFSLISMNVIASPFMDDEARMPANTYNPSSNHSYTIMNSDGSTSVIYQNY